MAHLKIYAVILAYSFAAWGHQPRGAPKKKNSKKYYGKEKEGQKSWMHVWGHLFFAAQPGALFTAG